MPVSVAWRSTEIASRKRAPLSVSRNSPNSRAEPIRSSKRVWSSANSRTCWRRRNPSTMTKMAQQVATIEPKPPTTPRIHDSAIAFSESISLLLRSRHRPLTIQRCAGPSVNSVQGTRVVSGRVLAKLGLVQEGRVRQRVRKWGVYEDVLLWAILRRDRSPTS